MWRRVLDVIELGERPSTAGNFPPSRSALRLEEELKIVSWSELKPHIDVFEADGKARIGLFVANNPVNWRDPFGLQTNVTDQAKEESEYQQCQEDMQKKKDEAAKWAYDSVWDLLKALWTSGKSPKAAKELLDSTVKDQVQDAAKDEAKDFIKKKTGVTNWIDRIDNYFKEKLIEPPKPPPASTNCPPKKCP